MRGDLRGFRVALCADALVNPPAGALDVLPVLEEEGWAVVALPATSYPASFVRARLELVAEECDELLRRGYGLLLLAAPDVRGGGLQRAPLRRAFRQVDQQLPAVYIAPREAGELRALLRAQPVPAAAS